MESDAKKSKSRPKHPREGANPFSVLTFGWTLPLFWKGRKKEMEEDELFEVLKEHKASALGDLFERAWLNELERCKGTSKNPSLKTIILKIFGCKLVIYGLLVFVTELVQCVVQPLMLGGLLDYFGSEDGNITNAYLYAGGIVVSSGASVFFHAYMMGLMHIGMKVRVGLSSLIYRKALKLNSNALMDTTVGQLVNLLSNDVNKFDYVFIYLHILWIGPVETCIVTYFVWRLIGPASIVGLVSLVIFIPFQAWLGKIVAQLRLKTATRTDERVRLMNEIISAIQVIKMYTWEKPFANLVSNARRKEINVISKSSYCKGIMLSFLMFHSRTTIFLSLLAYILLGSAVITAQKVFVVTCFYNSLRQTMTIFFPFGMASVAECLVSVERIEDFLMSDETEQKTSNNLAVPIIRVGDGDGAGPIVSLKGVAARWNEDQTENTLSSVHIDILPGKITAFIGPVGAGKSSLLNVMLKELPISEGNLQVSGSVSYASQDPWLFVGSIRQNILFGLPYNKERYMQVVRVCALTTDFEQLPYGDKTFIGERGVSLSGGQRARVSLARSVYKNADIYLLDDPLSAVDVHVGKHLFEDCIKQFLYGKTVVLVTHQLQYLNDVHHVVLLENGKVSAEGKFNDLLDRGLNFTNLLIGRMNEKRKLSRSTSIISVSSSEDRDTDGPPRDVETMFSGTVKQSVYLSYLRAGGGLSTLSFVTILFAIAQTFATGGDYWTAYWVNLEQYGFSHSSFATSRNICIYVFAGLTVATIIMTLIRSLMFFFMCMKASRELHDNMFSSITRATMRFFHTNSSGRILNRFSNDMGSIDELLPSTLADILQIGVSLIGVIVVVVVINPWILIPTFISAIIFYYLRSFYLGTARSVKRLEGVTRSPVFTHLTASLQGLTTIRAFKAQEILQSEFEGHQDLHSTAWYLYLSSHRAFGFWLDFVCMIYIAIITFNFLIVVPDTSYTGGSVGLAITQAIGLVTQFQWGMRLSAELESLMTSVERVLEYANLYSEPPLESLPGKKPKDSWPEKGEIIFDDVSLRYSPHDSWVLKGINFTIKPHQKVGIVGRTGAGKSSLIAALFRLSETEGEIKIDGIDSKSIGLHDFRSKISIIPQEPVLFSGSLRKNLDPFDQYSDEVLWNALEEVELKEVVSELASGLNAKMAEGGSNFSVGQKQLVCLARAIVRNNRILVLDEATANVDSNTDSLIQKTIRQKFADYTVITIAHRLMTVMDSDELFLIDSGVLVESGHPHLLLENQNSYLSRMVDNNNKSDKEILRKIAYDSYQKLAEDKR